VAEDRVVEPSVLAREVLAAELERAGDVLDLAAAQHERHEPVLVLRVEERDEAVDELGRRRRAPRRRSRLGFAQARPPAVERRLDRSRGGREHVGGG
jgi:hypothetical protein